MEEELCDYKAIHAYENALYGYSRDNQVNEQKSMVEEN